MENPENLQETALKLIKEINDSFFTTIHTKKDKDIFPFLLKSGDKYKWFDKETDLKIGNKVIYSKWAISGIGTITFIDEVNRQFCKIDNEDTFVSDIKYMVIDET